MADFRRLVTTALLAGVLAGGVLAVLQIVTIGPIIQAAEAVERAEAAHTPDAHVHGAGDWEPADGVGRTAYTVLGTVLTGIAYAAIALSVANFLGLRLDVRSGMALGAAGALCFAVAPALGLPPKPPGVAGAELHAAQTWWIVTAVSTAAGLALFFRAPPTWPWRMAAVACLVLPHAVGAPPPMEPPAMPADIIRRFAVLSVATQAAFWLVLGAAAGLLGRLLPGATARQAF